MENLIASKIKELTTNGKLDEIVTNEAEKFIKGIVSNVLTTYSETGKLFEQKITESVKDNFNKIDFVLYSKTIIDILEVELNKSVVKIGLDPIKKMINTFTGSLEKTNWKASEIIEAFIKDKVLNSYKYNSRGSIYFNYGADEYGFFHISFDEDSSIKESHKASYQLLIYEKDKHICFPKIDGKSHLNALSGVLYGFDLFLFKLYAMQCTIELDCNDIDTYYSFDID